MINGKDIYEVLSALVPLYIAMFLAYGSVKWWKIFTPDQCSGINRFVAVFAVPLLSFHFIASNNPYKMNFKFIAGDSLQKVVILVILFLWKVIFKRGGLEWMITLFSLSTLPNTLVMGIPLLKAMYGEFTGSLMAQIVVLQSVIWYTVMLVMFEYRAAKILINEQFPETAGAISSFKVESDVTSLSGRVPLEADAEIDGDGKLHVMVRRSSVSSSIRYSFHKSRGWNSIASGTPRVSNLSNVEIFSIQSSRSPTPRASSVSQADVHAILATNNKAPPNSPKHGYRNSCDGSLIDMRSSSGATTSRASNFEEEMPKINMGRKSGVVSAYPPPNPVISGSTRKKEGGATPNDKELHMFAWNSRASSVSDGHWKQTSVNGTADFIDFGVIDSSKIPIQHETAASRGIEEHGTKQHETPPTSVMTRLVAIMVWRKLIRNPNTYASVLGLVWSLISYRWDIEMPKIVNGSITILSDTGLGMAMFSLGLFMALQPRIIVCGKSLALISMAVRFLVGPAVVATTSAVVGIRGVLLQVAIVQAALPQGIVPFVFAKEYNVHADILSTAVIFGMVIALPITIIYYVLLGL